MTRRRPPTPAAPVTCRHRRLWLADLQWDAALPALEAEGWELIAVTDGPTRWLEKDDLPEGGKPGNYPGKWYFWRRHEGS